MLSGRLKCLLNCTNIDVSMSYTLLLLSALIELFVNKILEGCFNTYKATTLEVTAIIANQEVKY